MLNFFIIGVIGYHIPNTRGKRLSYRLAHGFMKHENHKKIRNVRKIKKSRVGKGALNTVP